MAEDTTSIDDKLQEWAFLVCRTLPVIVGENVVNPVINSKFYVAPLSSDACDLVATVPQVSIKDIQRLRQEASSMNFDGRPGLSILYERVTKYAERAEQLERFVTDELRQANAVLLAQEGLLDGDLAKRNFMETRIWQILDETYQCHVNLGLQCQPLQVCAISPV